MTLDAIELDRRGQFLLAGAIGEMPHTLMAREQLRRGLCRATVIGPADAPRAAVVQPSAFPGEATAYGDDPDLIWALLRTRQDWQYVEVSRDLAPAIAKRIAAATGHNCAFHEEIYFVLERPVPQQRDPRVRRLTLADLSLMDAATEPLQMGDWRFGSAFTLLEEGLIAGAIIDGELVAAGYTAARDAHYADVGIVTRADWRGHGLATAAAALVCADIQAAGQTPVWGTSWDNFASQRVADKLGFREVSRRVFVGVG